MAIIVSDVKRDDFGCLGWNACFGFCLGIPDGLPITQCSLHFAYMQVVGTRREHPSVRRNVHSRAFLFRLVLNVDITKKDPVKEVYQSLCIRSISPTK